MRTGQPRAIPRGKGNESVIMDIAIILPGLTRELRNLTEEDLRL